MTQKTKPHNEAKPPVISLIRRPHGFFQGVTEATVSPPITTSSFEWNTLILCEY